MDSCVRRNDKKDSLRCKTPVASNGANRKGRPPAVQWVTKRPLPYGRGSETPKQNYKNTQKPPKKRYQEGKFIDINVELC